MGNQDRKKGRMKGAREEEKRLFVASTNQPWYHLLVIPALRRLRLKNCHTEARLGHKSKMMS